ncbi:MAG: hypothetical protein GX850_04585 [Clostridiaceae bacterium]|jgi:hypothetical protein|nr:hypothetical protein [Clostridiaceae bacterium]
MTVLEFFKRKIKALDRDSDQAPPAYDPVFLISSPLVWSAHVESYLQERDIPFLKRGQMGAGLAIELGPVNEIYDYYVPREALEQALADLDELKELIGN